MAYSKGYVVGWHQMFILLVGIGFIVVAFSSCGAEAKSAPKQSRQVDLVLPPCTEVAAPVAYPRDGANCLEVEGLSTGLEEI
jgi:hypothetical protein